MPGEEVQGIRAVEYVQRSLKAGVDMLRTKKNPDEFLQRALAEWPLFDQLVARIYVDYQNAAERVDVAAREGLPGKDREIGYMTSHKELLAWMTRYAKAGREKRRALKG